MKNLILLFSVVLTLCGCSNDDNPKQDSIEFQTIAKGELGGNGAEGISQSNMVIKGEDTWTNLMAKMNSKNNVTFTETDIDFSTYMVLAVFLEVKNNGWKVEIVNLVENKIDIVVTIKETELVSSVITQPYHIVKIAKTDKNIVFK